MSYYVLYTAQGEATYFSAVCVQSPDLPRLQIQINKANLNLTLAKDTLQLIVNDAEIDFTQIEQDKNTSEPITGVHSDIEFQRTNVSLSVYLSSGVSLTVEAKNVSLHCYHSHLKFFAV